MIKKSSCCSFSYILEYA